MSALVARLAAIFGDPPPAVSHVEVLRGLWLDYLRRAPSDGSRLLVVLDGLDEAAGWQVGADMFPAIAPEHLRILVAARPLAGDADEIGWLQRLGWDQPARAVSFSLPTLSLGELGSDGEGLRMSCESRGAACATFSTARQDFFGVLVRSNGRLSAGCR